MQHIEGNRVQSNGGLNTVRLTIENGRVQEVRQYDTVDESLPILLPGFIDIHVHGGGGSDTMDATIDAFDTIARTHAMYGTTSLLLTTVTESRENINQVLQAAQEYMKQAGQGASVLGLHLEGPFIHPAKAGAQRSDCIIDPDSTLAEQWLNSGIVRMMTMAPERQHAHDVARIAASRGIIVSAGHTEATFHDMQLAKHAGFSHITHLCNAMQPLHHRDVGPIGYVIDDDNFTGDLICDGVHIDAPMVKTLIRAIGTDRLMLITDAIRAASLDSGVYELGGLKVRVNDGICRLENGNLAGSVLTMSKAVQNVQRSAGVSLFDAQKLSSLNPARRLNLATKGQIEAGFDADIVCMDHDFMALWTMVSGKIVYER